MSLGFLIREARLEICRHAASTALIPALDQTRSVGLVTIPGSFTSACVLGGASPAHAAAAMQLFVLVALLAVSAIALSSDRRVHRPRAAGAARAGALSHRHWPVR